MTQNFPKIRERLENQRVSEQSRRPDRDPLRSLLFATYLLFFSVVALAAATELPSPAGPDSGEPFLSVDASGRLLMSWLEPLPGGGHALRFSRREGSEWSPPATIASGNDFFVNWADFPSVIDDNHGSLFAHWLQKSGSSTYAYDVRMAISHDGGKTWSAPLLLNHDGRKVEHGFASVVPLRGGGVGAVWLDGRQMPENSEEGEMSLRYAAVDRAGKIRSEAVLDARTCECCTTAMAMTSSGPVVAYRDRSAKEIRDISVVRLAGGRWTKPSAIHADEWKIEGCPVNGPQIDGRGRRMAVAWFTAAGNEPRVNLAFSNDAGRSFAKPVRVDGGAPMGRVDVLLLADGSALVVWMEGLGNAARVVIRRVGTDGKPGPITKLADSSSARSSGFPRAALAGDTAYLAWTEPPPSKRVRIAAIPVADLR